ncbi:hypothetical protein SAMN05216388_101626 [Halorientalis persicus]|jgi:hypothetical protein|uniref:Uncharacterized protein n=1 Tax=Halorientalis persicus TaxID=1367881 RepID=A0A1H8RDJ7_9EURY|nr:hypothetical protein SAMN05216388_101626 [Halorientalis persicus]
MNQIEFVVAVVFSLGVIYSVIRWYLTDDERLNSEWFG